MSGGELPKDVRDLVIGHIDSVVQAEILLLLQSNPGQAYSAEQVGQVLRIDANGAEAQLAHLQSHGMLRAGPDGGGYVYGPQSVQLSDAVAGLARAYADRRVTVIALIYSKPTDQLRSFADAFRIRKDKDRG